METKFNKKEYNRVFSKEHYRIHKHDYYKQYYQTNRERITKYYLEYCKAHRKERAEKQRLRRKNKKIRKTKPNFTINSLTIHFD